MPRCHTIFKGLGYLPFIEFSEKGNILLGEEGRGRKQVALPVPQGSIVQLPTVKKFNYELLAEIQKASCRKLMETPRSGSALIRVYDQAGFRGDWEMRSMELQILHERLAGFEEQIRAAEVSKDYELMTVLRENLWSVQQEIHSCKGRLPLTWEIVSSGMAAEGLAGRAGSDPDILIMASSPDDAVIARHGRLYGGPSRIRVHLDDDGNVTLTDYNAERATKAAAGKY